jgi:hypothetical protein
MYKLNVLFPPWMERRGKHSPRDGRRINFIKPLLKRNCIESIVVLSVDFLGLTGLKLREVTSKSAPLPILIYDKAISYPVNLKTNFELIITLQRIVVLKNNFLGSGALFWRACQITCRKSSRPQPPCPACRATLTVSSGHPSFSKPDTTHPTGRVILILQDGRVIVVRSPVTLLQLPPNQMRDLLGRDGRL